MVKMEYFALIMCVGERGVRLERERSGEALCFYGTT